MKQRLGMMVLYYLRFWAKIQLKKIRPDIIGITGSAGKSSTRNAVVALFKDRLQVKVSWKANSESGIPLDILDISPLSYSPLDWIRMLLLAPLMVIFRWRKYDLYVVEMGIDSPHSPKNMEYLLSIVQPRIGILLNALPVHSEAFDSLIQVPQYALRQQKIVDLIADEKGKLLRSLPREGIAIVNADDTAAMRQSRRLAALLMTFGHSSSSDVVIAGIHYSKYGTRFEFKHEKETAAVVLPYFLPSHFASSFAAGLCAALSFGIKLADGCMLLTKNVHLPAGRMSRFDGINGSTILDSSYNASAEPVIDSLKMLSEIPAKRRLALLGDMRELGKETEGEHVRVITEAVHRVDKLYLVGPLMKQFAVPWLSKRHFPHEWFANASLASNVLKKQLTHGDVLLVKGSQNTIFLETAVEMLLAHKKDVAKLCRRGVFWDKARRLTI